MSKAFTRESDDAPEWPQPRRPAAALAPEGKNYITADGTARLQTELDRLLEGGGREHRGADPQRILQIRQILRTTTPVEPPDASEQRVRFGATVTLREPDGSTVQYRIVGLEESDPDRGWISWLSPLAKTLLQAEQGQQIRFRFPSGEALLDILKVDYTPPPLT